MAQDDDDLAEAAAETKPRKPVRELFPVTFDRPGNNRAANKDFRPVMQSPTTPPAKTPEVVALPWMDEATMPPTVTHPSNLPPE